MCGYSALDSWLSMLGVTMVVQCALVLAAVFDVCRVVVSY